ncbi:calcium-binding protein [Synechococcus sp. RedBA-s]|uniref:calcium-binding protein n=1 Tax=Synechococcus sp. RedBA-s TaxID=2823741 RepID=UPI0020CD2DA5|nr:hypothetical protein [Synechococcus sp. RedBA-s]MCP9799176.1 hypothetical protein [Synechococcus sp. RedBA-s]
MASTPSAVRNTPAVGDDGVVRFSIESDDVNLNDFIGVTNGTGSLVAMLDGDDVVIASEKEITGSYANRVGGNKGNDVLNGSSFQDQFLGGQGDDFVSGLGGDDFLNGNLGSDAVRGGDGNDVVRGGQGLDLLYGGSGDDILTGDFDNDDLRGDEGRDIFGIRTETDAFGDINKIDHIVDFTAGQDRIAIKGINSFFDLTFIQETAPDFEEQPDGNFEKNDNIPGVSVIALIDGSQKYLCFIRNVTLEQVQSSANFITGTTADDLFSKLTPDAFLQNPNLIQSYL